MEMSVAMFVVQATALLYVAFGLGMLVDNEYYDKVYKGLAKNTELLFSLGFMLMVFGLMVVSVHNVWVWHWSLIATIVGWGMLIKGLFFIAFPWSVEMMIKAFMGPAMKKVMPWFVMALGLVLAYVGFVVA